MNMPEHFHLEPDYGYSCPEGKVSLQEGIDLVSGAIACCADQQVRKLLVNTTGLTGYAAPTMSDHFFLAGQLSKAAKSVVRIAVVLRPELIDPGKFGSRSPGIADSWRSIRLGIGSGGVAADD